MQDYAVKGHTRYIRAVYAGRGPGRLSPPLDVYILAGGAVESSPKKNAWVPDVLYNHSTCRRVVHNFMELRAWHSWIMRCSSSSVED